MIKYLKVNILIFFKFYYLVDVVVDGDIRVNGRPMGDYMNQLCGYVPQEDIFVRDVTVREHLHFMVSPNKE